MVYKSNISEFGEICEEHGGKILDEGHKLVCDLSEATSDDFLSIARWIERHKDEIKKDRTHTLFIAKQKGEDIANDSIFEYQVDYDKSRDEIFNHFKEYKTVLNPEDYDNLLEDVYSEIGAEGMASVNKLPKDISYIAKSVLTKNKDKLSKGVKCSIKYNPDWDEYDLICEATTKGKYGLYNFESLEEGVWDAMRLINDDFIEEVYNKMKEGLLK